MPSLLSYLGPGRPDLETVWDNCHGLYLGRASLVIIWPLGHGIL